jgi:hypothetical protein
LDNRPDIVGHSGMIDIWAHREPASKTTFIVRRNLCCWPYRLGALFDRYPNLCADISATRDSHHSALCFRFYRYANACCTADKGYNTAMYRITFRVLETLDEHFYESDQFGYHWSMNGFGLRDPVLKDLPRECLKILNRKPRNSHAGGEAG